MRTIFHLITTINRGGAENQLLVLVLEILQFVKTLIILYQEQALIPILLPTLGALQVMELLLIREH